MTLSRACFLATLFSLTFLLTAVSLATAETIYTVQPGDTLASIARRYSTTITAVAQTNNIVNPNLIYVGQTLTIPSEQPSQPTTPPPTQPPPQQTNPPTNLPTTTTYTVQPGDTLMRIGLRFGVSTAVLTQANNLTNPNLIYVGQTLTIPSEQPTPPPSQPIQPTPVPPAPPNQPTNPSTNLLPNPSFEGGWYHPGGNPELQIPADWRFEWDEGATGFGNNSWDVYRKPEVRVLSRAYLPPAEHAQFIFSGNQTVKVFKGSGPISFRMLTDVALQPGTYRLTVRLFPDLVVGYSGGQKVWATDPSSGDVRLIAPGGGTAVLFPAFGQRNEYSTTFTLSQAQTVTVGAALRGRFALENNGYFVDDWSLVRLP